MPIESDGHSKDNPRLFELIEHAPRTGMSPTVWAWPQLIDYLKVAGQPVPGPWPPHQEPRPDPGYDSGPQAIPDPHSLAPDTVPSRTVPPNTVPPHTVPPPRDVSGDGPAERRN